VVRLRFFAGLDIEQTAKVLGISPRTVKRQWQFARAWLYRELER
jgi:DNA-directed RNA polymerase specialized sigma24 family protein